MRGGEDHRKFDTRGSSKSRARRREIMLTEHAYFVDDEVRVDCHHCQISVRHDLAQIDRYPICGHAGGKYSLENLVWACYMCNGGRCSKECRNR